MTEQINKKVNYWQELRAICIFFVMMIHCTNPLQLENQVQFQWSMFFWIVERNIVNCAVAVFIFMAGYFVKQSVVKQNTRKWLTKRCKRLLIPYSVWTLVYVFIKYDYGAGIWHLPVRFLKSLVLGGAAPQLYYIVVLFQLTLLTPVLLKVWGSDRKILRMFFILLTPLYLLALTVYGLLLHRTLPHYQVPFLGWLIYYLIGLFYSKQIGEIVKKQQKTILYVLAGGLLGCLGSYGLLFLDYPLSGIISQLRITNMIYSILVICCVMQLSMHQSQLMPKCFEIDLMDIGDISYGIYFIHYIPILIVQNLVTSKLYGFIGLPFLQLLEFLVALIFSVVICWTVKKIIGNKSSGLLLGI